MIWIEKSVSISLALVKDQLNRESWKYWLSIGKYWFNIGQAFKYQLNIGKYWLNIGKY